MEEHAGTVKVFDQPLGQWACLIHLLPSDLGWAASKTYQHSLVPSVQDPWTCPCPPKVNLSLPVFAAALEVSHSHACFWSSTSLSGGFGPENINMPFTCNIP